MLGKWEEEKFDLVEWLDFNWAQDHDNRRLTSGFVFDVAESSISWSSKKQATVVTSSVETEYIVLANATTEAIWLHTLLIELDFPLTMATMIYADNQGCIALANNPVSHSHTKHIDIRHYFIQKCIKRREIRLNYISTKDMLADIFTKALPCEAFERFRNLLEVLPLA